jgi:tripeptidyl-peptidase-1
VTGYLEKANVTELGYVNAEGVPFESLRPAPGPGKLFNLVGRGYPDVAAVGENFRVVLRGYPNRMHGTSASTPVWASILTLINEERLAAGKSTVGFVHQVLVSPLFQVPRSSSGADDRVVRTSGGVYRHHHGVKPRMRRGWVPS